MPTTPHRAKQQLYPGELQAYPGGFCDSPKWAERTYFGWEKLTLSVSDIDAFPPEEASVEGQCTRAEQGQGNTERTEQNVEPDIAGLNVDMPQLNERDKAASDRRPKSHNQQSCQYQRDQHQNQSSSWGSAWVLEDSLVSKSTTGDQAHEQQRRAGPTAGECGEQSSQERAVRLRPTLKGQKLTARVA